MYEFTVKMLQVQTWRGSKRIKIEQRLSDAARNGQSEKPHLMGWNHKQHWDCSWRTKKWPQSRIWEDDVRGRSPESAIRKVVPRQRRSPQCETDTSPLYAQVQVRKTKTSRFLLKFLGLFDHFWLLLVLLWICWVATATQWSLTIDSHSALESSLLLALNSFLLFQISAIYRLNICILQYLCWHYEKR